MDSNRLMTDCIKAGLKPKTIQKYKLVLRLCQRVANKKIELWKKKDLEKLFLWFHGAKLANDTKINWWFTAKKIVKWYNKPLTHYFEEYKLNLKSKLKTYDEILTVEEINLLLRFSIYLRTKTLIALLYELGCRPGELVNIRLGSIEFHEDYAVISLNGKTGPRTIPIVQSCRLLKEYMRYHQHNTPDSLLFSRADKKYSNAPLSYNGITKMLRESACKAGITKRIYPYILRHSRVSHMDGILSDHEKKLYFGWTLTSKMPSIYTHLSPRSVQDKILSINGIISKPKEIFRIEPEPSVIFSNERKEVK